MSLTLSQGSHKIHSIVGVQLSWMKIYVSNLYEPFCFNKSSLWQNSSAIRCNDKVDVTSLSYPICLRTEYELKRFQETTIVWQHACCYYIPLPAVRHETGGVFQQQELPQIRAVPTKISYVKRLVITADNISPRIGAYVGTWRWKKLTQSPLASCFV